MKIAEHDRAQALAMEKPVPPPKANYRRSTREQFNFSDVQKMGVQDAKPAESAAPPRPVAKPSQEEQSTSPPPVRPTSPPPAKSEITIIR